VLDIALAAAGLAGSTVGAAVAVPLIGPFQTRAARERVLGGMLLGLAGFAGLISARVLGLVSDLPAIDHLINIIGLATAPLAVIYAAEETDVRRRWWLWIPTLVYLLAILALAVVAADTGVPFIAILPVALSFTVAAITLRRSSPREGSDPGTLVSRDAVIGFLIVLNLAQIARWLLSSYPGVRALLPLVVTSLMVAVSARLAQRLSGLAPPARVPTTPRYERSGLDAAQARDVLDAALAALARNRGFADPSLTLRGLADAAHTTPHNLSEALNLHGGRSFNDLLNEMRIDDAKAQLLDPSNDRFTIEGIAQSSGFRSRSAFYTTFRRLVGVTPAEFRSRAKNPPQDLS
jgi:AraC-like DNA-binding protein